MLIFLKLNYYNGLKIKKRSRSSRKMQVWGVNKREGTPAIRRSKPKMATTSGDRDAVVYIMPQRIPKRMLQDIKSAVLRTNIPVAEKFE